MTEEMTSLPSMATVQARIFSLPGRPPFMIADDLAEFYQVTRKRLMEQVRRNARRFPEGYIFEMTDEEYRKQLPHFAATAERKRTDLTHYGFTKKGALQLSSVLSGPVADAVSVTIIDTFSALEEQAFDEVRFRLDKLRSERVRSKPVRFLCSEGVRLGYDFETIWRLGDYSYSRPRIAQALRDCLALGLIDRLPDGMPPVQADLFGAGA